MLAKLVTDICKHIEDIPFDAMSELTAQIRANAPDTIDDLVTRSRGTDQEVDEQQAAYLLAFCAMIYIKGVPAIARTMLQSLNDGRIPFSHQCAIASILTYLVQPHDLLSDNLPGMYGLVDDAVIVNSGIVAYLDGLPQGFTADQHAAAVNFLAATTPPQVRQALQLQSASLTVLVQLLQFAGDDVARGTLQFMIANPLVQPHNLQAPPSFAPRPRTYDAGRWWGGFYVEGHNIIAGGGGPALIDGQLFIP